MTLKEKYPNLSQFCRTAMDLYDLCDEYIFEKRLDWVSGHWPLEHLIPVKAELTVALQDQEFDWFIFATENDLWDEKQHGLFTSHWSDTNRVSSEEYFLNFKMRSYPLIYPEYRLSLLKNEYLRRTIFYILRDIALMTNEWVDLSFLLKFLRQYDTKWEMLEPFHIETIWHNSTHLAHNYPISINRVHPSDQHWERYFYFNPIQHLQISPYLNRYLLEFHAPRNFCDFSDWDIENGFLLPDFKWSFEDSIQVHNLYHEYKVYYFR